MKMLFFNFVNCYITNFYCFSVTLLLFKDYARPRIVVRTFRSIRNKRKIYFECLICFMSFFEFSCFLKPF